MNIKNIIFSIVLVFLISFGAQAGVSKYHLKNGITVLLNKDSSSEVVSVGIYFLAGSYYETEADNGINNMAFEMLLKGTATRDLYAFASEAESLGTGISVNGGTDYSSVSVLCTKKHMPRSLDLAADAVIAPAFPESELGKLKEELLSEIKAKEDNNFKYSYQLFREMVYAGTPFRFDPLGTEQNVKKITAADLKAWHKKYFTGNNILISVSGDFFEEDMLSGLERRFGNMPEGVKSTPGSDGRIKLPGPLERTVKADKKQSFVIEGFVVPGAAHRDYLSLKVLSAVLGGGMSSKLFNTLREKEGLAYEIGSFYPTSKEDGVFVFYAGTRKENIDRVKKGIIEQLDAAKKEGGITAEEVEKAKNYIIGNFRLAHQTNSSRQWYYAFYEMIGKGCDYDGLYVEDVKKVSVNDVREMFSKYFTNSAVFVLEAEK